MPFAMVERDLTEGALVEIELQDADTNGLIMPMYATYRTELPPGPAGRWLIEQFRGQEETGLSSSTAAGSTEGS